MDQGGEERLDPMDPPQVVMPPVVSSENTATADATASETIRLNENAVDPPGYTPHSYKAYRIPNHAFAHGSTHNPPNMLAQPPSHLHPHPHTYALKSNSL